MENQEGVEGRVPGEKGKGKSAQQVELEEEEKSWTGFVVGYHNDGPRRIYHVLWHDGDTTNVSQANVPDCAVESYLKAVEDGTLGAMIEGRKTKPKKKKKRKGRY